MTLKEGQILEGHLTAGEYFGRYPTTGEYFCQYFEANYIGILQCRGNVHVLKLASFCIFYLL